MDGNFEKKDILIILFFAVLTAAALFPLLFLGRIWADSDALALFYPFFDFYSKAIQNGDSFLWNPLVFSGFPTYVSQSGGFLDPINRIIFSFVDGFTGVNFRLFLDYFLMMVFSYLAGRAYGVSRLASSMIGMSYLLSVNLILYLSNPILANCIFVLPFLLFIFKQSLTGGFQRWLWSVIGGLGVGWAFLSGSAQITIYGLCLFLIFVVSYFFVAYEGQKNLKTVFLWIASIAVIFGVGLIAGVPLILPAAVLTPLSMRVGGIDIAIALGKYVWVGDFFLFLFPGYHYFPYLADGYKSIHIGALMFFLAIVSAVIIIRYWRSGIINNANNSAVADERSWAMISGKVKNATPFAIGALFALLLAIQYSPLSYVLQHLPVFKLFRYIDRWMYIGTFFWAALGAWGFDLIRHGAGDRVLKRIFAILGVMVGGVAVFISALNFGGDFLWTRAVLLLDRLFSLFVYGRFGFAKDPFHYRGAIERGIEAWQKSAAFGNWTFLIPFIILIIAFAITALFLWQKISWRNFRITGFILSVAAFLTVFSSYTANYTISLKDVEQHRSFLNRFVSSEEEFDLYRTYPVFLMQGWGKIVKPTYKITPKDTRASTQLKFSAGWPNIHMLSHIQSAEGYELLMSNDLHVSLAVMGSDFGGQYKTKFLSNEENIDRLMSHLDVLGMMAGKYIISGIELPRNPDLHLLGEAQVSDYRIPLYIYENKKALPKFYFAKEVVEKPSRALFDLIQEGSREFHRKTYLDCDGCVVGSNSTFKNSDFELILYRNGFIKIKTKSDTPRWFIASESYYPGWRIELDGKEHKIVRANGIYMAVEVPEGEHEITFHYEGVLGEAAILRRIGFME